MAEFNPIETVEGASVPCPSKFDYLLQDVSSPDAGRTEDGLMHKCRIAQKVKLELEWKNIPISRAGTILRAFNNEYLTIKYFDLKSNSYLTKEFYVGDRTTPVYSMRLGICTLTFNVIER